MTARIWHKGPPPHVGWWIASLVRDQDPPWRWWNGKHWSHPAYEGWSAEAAATSAMLKAEKGAQIEWTEYWPENARVPRIDPATGAVTGGKK